jgi:nucleotide-binding universal stress UspA family protein
MAATRPREAFMYKRALVPLDGSPLAEAVIPFVVAIAGPLDMAVVLLRVVEPIPPMSELPSGVAADALDRRARDAAEYLAPLAAELRARGIDAAWEIRRGQVSDSIVRATRSTGADVIAMSTHGRSGLGRLLFGSVAEQVLRQADVPVLLLRQTEDQPAVAMARELAR